MSWDNANQYCSDNFGTELATIKNAEENQLIIDEVGLQKTVWIGMNDRVVEGPLGWIDGYSVPGMYTNWEANEPNDYGSGEDCGSIWGGHGGRWNDYPCSRSEWFACNPNPNVCYGGFSGNPAYVWGDPHFTLFNGKKHDYQGVRGEFYYYMRPCNGWTKNEMPFNMIAKHYQYGRVFRNGNSRNTIEYITMELFDPNSGVIYYCYFNGAWAYWTSTSIYSQASYDYDLAAYANALTSLSNGVTQLGVYKITMTPGSGGYKSIIIDIDDRVLGCPSTKDISFRMRPTRGIVGDRYRIHRMFVDPPGCARCYQCCLLGDFTNRGYGWNNPETGIDTTIKPGYTYGDTGDADWGCKVKPNEYPSPPSDYVPPSPDVPYPDFDFPPFCDPIENPFNEDARIAPICQQVYNNNQACCNAATQDACSSILSGCAGDTCAELDLLDPVTIDDAAILAAVQLTIVDELAELCNEPGFDPNNIISTAPTSVTPQPTFYPTPNTPAPTSITTSPTTMDDYLTTICGVWTANGGTTDYIGLLTFSPAQLYNFETTPFKADQIAVDKINYVFYAIDVNNGDLW
eukprot:CAMPEP_0114655804 /NCGR_PEP_ID=MMETSP0191-20121206/11442_1 /TAXON_ID=126664 /ORGANISM="Sorites sp." /LENGTH=571 /DNA_ID=CAMNT_0001871849 /DNA_START=160 /DNA_END=1872 /DNA_ORIENTATION=-